MECRRRESHLRHGLMQHHLKTHGGSSCGLAETVVVSAFPLGHRIVPGSCGANGRPAVSAFTSAERTLARAVLRWTCAKRSHLTLHLRKTKPRRFLDTSKDHRCAGSKASGTAVGDERMGGHGASGRIAASAVNPRRRRSAIPRPAQSRPDRRCRCRNPSCPGSPTPSRFGTAPPSAGA